MVYQTILASTLRYAIVAPAASQIPHCLGSTGAETPYSLRLLASVAVDSAAVVLDNGDTEVLRGALGGVDLTARMYPETMAVSVNVGATAITTPEGTFLRTGTRMERHGSLLRAPSQGETSRSSARRCMAKTGLWVHTSDDNVRMLGGDCFR